MKNIILILLFLVPSLSHAQSRYLQNGQDGFAVSLGTQSISGSSKNIGFISISGSSKGRSDFGLQIGKSGNITLISIYTKAFLIKQNEHTPLSFGVTAQGDHVKQSSSYYSRTATSFTFGTFLETNILSSKKGGIVPYLGAYYTSGDQENESSVGGGISFYTGKDDKIAFDIGYLATEGQYNSVIAAITITFKSNKHSNRNYIIDWEAAIQWN